MHKNASPAARLFTPSLLAWNQAHNDRQMPWKGEQDPYKIWLSEVILQQTRVAQGLAYYERFVQQYPTVQALAAAPDDAVFRLWEGLGYYSRARNLLTTARWIVANNGGHFPNSYEGLLALKGVGPYTAAAIASFAFGLPHAVVDGNVYRVLSRVFGLTTPIDLPEAKAVYNPLAEQLLNRDSPGSYNQAIMDFGATVCTPQQPRCAGCPMAGFCTALAQGKVNQLPVRAKRLERRHRFFLYLLLQHSSQLYLQQRPLGDIWAGLYEPYLLEQSSVAELNKAAVVQTLETQLGVDSSQAVVTLFPLQKQLLTHQQLTILFAHVNLETKPSALPAHQWYTAEMWAQLPKPQQIAQFLKNNSPQASLW